MTTENPTGSFSIFRLPLYLRVLLGVIVGATLGFTFQNREIVQGWTNADSGQLAALYVLLLTALATPLVFFAIVDAFVQTEITGRQGVFMFGVCLFNIVVAFTIGLTILNVARPGAAWKEKFAEIEGAEELTAKTETVTEPAKQLPANGTAKNPSLSPLGLIRTYVPKSIVQPFTENMVLSVAMLAIFSGAALRSLKSTEDPVLKNALRTFDDIVIVSFQIVLKLLLWLIELAPIAICLAVAGVVGETGTGAFKMVGVFLLTVCCTLGIHSLIYYPLSIWGFAGKSPLMLFREGGSAILTGLSLNSSLATAPLTLVALKKMGVSDSAARLSACVGTNFNNDGVTLYEAITALFVAQALGMDTSLTQQITILIAALIGSMGIAGIPNSGLIILALVLKAAKLPDSAIQLAIPLVYSVDFLIARLRSAVNVMGDLQVAIVLDAAQRRFLPDTVAAEEATLEEAQV